jgi:hypothetical protein
MKRSPSTSFDSTARRGRQRSISCDDGDSDAAYLSSPLGAKIRATSEGCSEIIKRSVAPFDTIVIKNRSSQEVKAQLFRSTDLCCILPVASEVMAPFSESRFQQLGTLSKPADATAQFTSHWTLNTEFTLKVYSVGVGAKELTYLTASCGHTYMFCDSLIT